MADGQSQQTLQKEYGQEFEQALLWMILVGRSVADVDPNIIDDSGIRFILQRRLVLREEYGQDPTLKMVVSDLHECNKTSEENTFNKLSSKRALSSITTILKQAPPSDQDQAFIQNKLHRFVLRRELVQSIQLCAADVVQGRYEQVLDRIQDVFERNKQNGQTIGVGTIYSNVDARIVKYAKAALQINGVPSGIPNIDNKMRGGLGAGTLGVIMGFTGRGKTMLMVNIGATALNYGVDVVHCTIGDVSEVDAALRYDGCRMDVEVNDIAKHPTKHMQKLRAGLAQLKSKLFIREWGADECTVDDIAAYLQLLVTEHDVCPGVLIVDYANLIRPIDVDGEDARYRKVGGIIKRLRQLGKDFACAVWTGTQTGRANFSGKSVRLSDVWESLETVQTADVVIGLCQTAHERRTGHMRLLLMKNRLGGHEGTIVNCNVFPETQRIMQALDQSGGLLWGSQSDQD